MPVETIVEDVRWHEVGLEALAARAAACTLDHLGLDPGGWEIAVLACDDTRIAALNSDFRGTSVATNVLSWPAEDRAPDRPGELPRTPAPDGDDDGDDAALGDIAIAWESCAREAAQAGCPLDDHVTHLCVHAVLHLLGFDHVRDADATLMEATEIEILGKLGVADPYTGNDGQAGPTT